MSEKILRSHEWFQRKGLDGFIYRSWLRNQGLPDDALDGRPVIGICNSWSDLTPCNGHFRELAEHVKKGVLDAGGLLRLSAGGWLRLSWPHLNSGGRFACWFRKVAGWLRCFVWGPTRSSS